MKYLFSLLLALALLPAKADTTFTIVEGLDNQDLKATMEKNVSTMIEVMRNATENHQKAPELKKEFFGPDAINDLKQMWKSSAMSCPPANIRARCLTTSTGYQVRGIPVDLVEADENDARQELTVDFDQQGRIASVAISIDMHRYDLIMAEKADEMDYARRQVIVNFVENFRTAYNRKDLALINSVFSDKALIITGRVVQEKPNSDIDRLTLRNNKVVYIKQSKQEYLRNLGYVFKKNKFINVKFDDIEVTQHPKYDEIYGVTLKQTWRSDRYSDEGYLFLMIDFRSPDNPQIQVRTWQPYKDNQGLVVTNKADVFHLGSFRIVR